MIAKFNLGKILVSNGVKNKIDDKKQRLQEISDVLTKHMQGDWGCISEADRQANEEKLKDMGMLLSAYELSLGKVFIITEGDRTVTTVMFPEEY